MKWTSLFDICRNNQLDFGAYLIEKLSQSIFIVIDVGGWEFDTAYNGLRSLAETSGFDLPPIVLYDVDPVDDVHLDITKIKNQTEFFVAGVIRDTERDLFKTLINLAREIAGEKLANNQIPRFCSLV